MTELSPAPAPLLHTSNIAGSPGATFAGLAAMAPAIAQAVSSFHMPTTLAEWLSIGLGVLAVLARG